jgi:SAM-dependent methyltransferase
MKEHRQLFEGKTVLDVGTGSGIIALYAARLGARKVVATDISSAALACTQANAVRLGYGAAIETRLVALSDTTAYAVVKTDEVFDAIVSNPPYTLNLDATAGSALIDRGELGFSLVKGLAQTPQRSRRRDSALCHVFLSRGDRQAGALLGTRRGALCAGLLDARGSRTCCSTLTCNAFSSANKCRRTPSRLTGSRTNVGRSAACFGSIPTYRSPLNRVCQAV